MTRISTVFIQAAKPGTTIAQRSRKRTPPPTKAGGGKETRHNIPIWTATAAPTPQTRRMAGARRLAGALITGSPEAYGGWGSVPPPPVPIQPVASLVPPSPSRTSHLDDQA